MVREDTERLETHRVRNVRSSVSRYDLLLAVIPLAIGGAMLTGRVLDVPLETALLGGVAVALLAVIDGLFLRPPSGMQGT